MITPWSRLELSVLPLYPGIRVSANFTNSTNSMEFEDKMQLIRKWSTNDPRTFCELQNISTSKFCYKIWWHRSIGAFIGETCYSYIYLALRELAIFFADCSWILPTQLPANSSRIVCAQSICEQSAKKIVSSQFPITDSSVPIARICFGHIRIMSSHKDKH